MKNQFTLVIDVESDLDASDTVIRFQKFFDYYHPRLNAKVRKPVEVTKPAKVEEDLL
jgi:hypothetical protein